MHKGVFEFEDFRKYLREALPTKGVERGIRSRLASELGVQKGLVSSVLSGGAELALEQALRVSRFMNHTAEETDFFLLLVQYSRAGSKDLEAHYLFKIRLAAAKRREIRERIHARDSLSEADQLRYYSSWHFTAVHMCLMQPNLRLTQKIAAYLGLTVGRTDEILKFFDETGLAQATAEGYISGSTRIHIGTESPHIARHHSNWRLQAIQALDHDRKDDLHYSAVMSISRVAADKIREILLHALQSAEVHIRDAKDEDVFALNMDLFSLQKPV